MMLIPVINSAPVVGRFSLHDRALLTADVVKWREKIYRKFRYFSDLIKKTVERIEFGAYRAACDRGRAHESNGMYMANCWLREAVERFYLVDGSLNLFSSDQALRDWADATAAAMDNDITRLAMADKWHAIEYIIERFNRLAVDLPESVEKYIGCKGYESDEHRRAFGADLGRMISRRWWLRRVRVMQARALESFCREMGLVNIKAGKYVSDYSLTRRWKQKKRNRDLLEGLIATNELGQSYSLQELSDLGVANPMIRRMELMARIGGFERLAVGTGLFVAMFYTVTCPSKYHAYHVWGGRNDKWVAAGMPTPRDAQEYLNGVWSRVRADLKRAGARWFGFAIAEPHHDGCPHWHLILWLQPDKKDLATRIFEHHAIAEDREELTNKITGKEDTSPRFKPVEIDESKGTATGYVVKYVSKNIDGSGVECDSYCGDAVEGAARIEAWASTWGIRQFRQIGGPSVTVWRELRRCRDEMILPDEEFEKIQQAANEGNWQAFTELMGGPTVARDDMRIRAHMVARVERNDYDEIVMKIEGVVFAGRVAITRRHEWTISIKRESTSTKDNGYRAPPGAA